MIGCNLCQLLVFDFDNHAKGAEQDALPEGGLGNVIVLPLQGMALKNGNSAWVKFIS